MTRVKRGTQSLKRRHTVLAMVKGGRFGISKKERRANEVIRHAGVSQFRDRKRKKGDFRKLWIVRLNAAIRAHGMSYSVFINKLTKKNVGLNRKILSSLAKEHPKTFKAIVEKVES